MRKIKFRAWDKKEHRMIENPYLFDTDCGGVVIDYGINDCFVDTGIFEIMQFTGLVDKNGKEIYEGDTIFKKCGLHGIQNVPNDYSGIVEYGRSAFGIRSLKNEDDWDYLDDFNGVEIIGNIYENNPP